MNIMRRQLLTMLPILSCLLVFATTAVNTKAQKIHVSVSTRSTAGFAQPRIKVMIGSYAVTTDGAGVGSVDLPAGTYKVKAVTKCRVVRFSRSHNINMEEVGGTSTEPVVRITGPQQGPLGIQFELDCKNKKSPPGRT